MNGHVHRSRAARRFRISCLGFCAALVFRLRRRRRFEFGPISASAASASRSLDHAVREDDVGKCNVFHRDQATRQGRSRHPKICLAQYVLVGILTDGANLISVGTFPGAPDCSPNPNAPGAFICTASINVPAGNHVFTMTAYDSLAPAGRILSTNTTGTIAVKASGTTAVSIVLTTNPPIGTAAAIGLTAVMEDADRNLIVGPAPYEHPVTLTTTDSTNGGLTKTSSRHRRTRRI